MKKINIEKLNNALISRGIACELVDVDIHDILEDFADYNNKYYFAAFCNFTPIIVDAYELENYSSEIGFKDINLRIASADQVVAYESSGDVFHLETDILAGYWTIIAMESDDARDLFAVNAIDIYFEALEETNANSIGGTIVDDPIESSTLVEIKKEEPNKNLFII